MRKTNNEKYSEIVEQEKNILNTIKSDIQDGRRSTIENFDAIQNSLEKMEYSKKQIEAINKIKNVINSILESIVNAETIEELNALRNSLNNEIRKVRRVLSKVESFDMQETERNIASVRRSISELYRNKKRDVTSICDLLANEENLSKEDKALLAKKLRNESSYIKRYNNSKAMSEAKQSDNSDKMPEQAENNDASVQNLNDESFDNEVDKTDSQDASLDGLDELSIVEIIDEQDDAVLNDLNDQKASEENSIIKTFAEPVYPKVEPDFFGSFKTEEDEFRSRTAEECMRYNVTEPIMYGKNPIQNIVSFFKNVSIYRNNRMNFRHVNYDLAFYTSFRGTKMVSDYLYDATKLSSVLYRMFFHKNYEYSESKYAKQFVESIEYIRALIRSNDLSNESSEETDYDFVDDNGNLQRTL